MQKEKYDAPVEKLSKKLNFNDKMKKHTKKHSCCSRVLFRLKKAKHNDLDLQLAIMLGKRCYEQLINVKRSGETDVEPSKPKYQKPGG